MRLVSIAGKAVSLVPGSPGSWFIQEFEDVADFIQKKEDSVPS